MRMCYHAGTSICNTNRLFLESKVQALRALHANKPQQADIVLPLTARTEFNEVVQVFSSSIMCSAAISSFALPVLQVTQVVEHIVSLFGKLDHDASNMCISTSC